MKNTIKQSEIAEVIARKAFYNKVDKAGKPYIYHLERVADSVSKCRTEGDGYLDIVRSVAWLHDLLEDCPEWNESILSQIFSDDIVSSVVLLTKKEGQDYMEYINAVADNMYAYDVKRADIIDNLDITRFDSISESDIKRINKYLKALKHLNSL